ncbi:MAG: ABC transporter permease, partial [Melioribacter sp.]|nr:ABC transporter permease [Melioribacter sp.]
MKIYTISLQSLRRKKAKTFFLLTGLMLSVSSVVMLFTVSKNVNSNVASLLDEFGANIIITPKSGELSFNYAGISVNSTTYELYELKNDDIDKIRTIKNRKNISIIAPKLFVLEEINGKKIIITGIDMKEEVRLKKWWKIYGKIPSSDNEILVGSKAMEKLSIRLNDKIQVAGHFFIVAGFIEETGSQDDAMIFMPIKTVQQLFNKKDKISLIEVAALCYDCPIEEIVRQTSKVLPNANVTPIKQTIESKMTAVHRFEH